jgi:acetyl-CoA carboxylase biotin carboxyl carrier protein
VAGVTDAQEPAAQQPLAQQPLAQQPLAQQPLAQQPLAQPFGEQPILQQSLDQQPLAPEPVSPELAALERAALERSAVARKTSGSPAPGPRLGDGDASLLDLVDRLIALLERSDLAELEVEAGGTGLVLRKPSALPPDALGAAADVGASQASPPLVAVPPERPSVKAPLTGIFYGSPAPGSAPFVTVGGEVAVGTVIGLIEAMKLFNEIKSDLAGRVVRVVAESGALVKAKQPLIEVEPL